MMKKLLIALGNFKPGTMSYVITTLLVAAAAITWTQYRLDGSVGLKKMIGGSSSGEKLFWQRNPQLEFVDTYVKTSFVLARAHATGASASVTGTAMMLDYVVVMSAQVKPRACDFSPRVKSASIYPGASATQCFDIVKPDTGSGDPYAAAASFVVLAKDSQVQKFYADLFASLGYKVNVMQNDSRGIVLEAEDNARNTVARVAIHGAFDTCHGFLAWTADFAAPPSASAAVFVDVPASVPAVPSSVFK